MRVLLIALLLIGIMVVFLFLGKPTSITPKPEPSQAPIVSLTPSPPARSVDIDDNGKTYRVVWLSVRDPSMITLIPNFTQKRTSQSLIDAKECTAVVSGGFYTKDNQPTGLFVNEGKTLRSSIPNTLLNGFFVIDKDNRATIGVSAPEGSMRIGLQTGPVLIRDGNAIRLTIRDDELARRVVVGITQKEDIVFLALYDPDNPWSGPKLADTPAILSKVAARLQLRDALNLDGGSASAFIRDDLSLEELTSVGSFFCVN